MTPHLPIFFSFSYANFIDSKVGTRKDLSGTHAVTIYAHTILSFTFKGEIKYSLFTV